MQEKESEIEAAEAEAEEVKAEPAEEAAEAEAEEVKAEPAAHQKKPNYKNWMPLGMIVWLIIGCIACIAGIRAVSIFTTGIIRVAAVSICSIIMLVCAASAAWCIVLYRAFDFNGKRGLSRQIIDGIAEYITLPEGGKGLDVGCGSGALTIACAKKNPQGSMQGLDLWGMQYISYSKSLCKKNAAIEGVADKTEFTQGDACWLPFEDETFDAVTSNYVYHNITGLRKKDLVLETLRTLKKGGCFAIHDIMSEARYGDMEAFRQMLINEEGYERVELIDTTDGKFMSKKEGSIIFSM
ncbi:MAG: class I SAM-dependent methyltransferase [Eubacteriales bacterium]|nr:class I SAM-dependent methyltransferase [Eubacteriales bacterium]